MIFLAEIKAVYHALYVPQNLTSSMCSRSEILYFFFFGTEYDCGRRLILRLKPYLVGKGCIEKAKWASRVQRHIIGISWSQSAKDLMKTIAHKSEFGA